MVPRERKRRDPVSDAHGSSTEVGKPPRVEGEPRTAEKKPTMKKMELPSTVSLLLSGFDKWVVQSKPCCEDASRVLRCLQRASMQTKSVSSQTVPSIPVLLQNERYGRTGVRAFNISSMPTDALLF